MESTLPLLVAATVAAKADASEVAALAQVPATVTFGTSGSFTYQLITIHTAGRPGLIGKRFAGDYEKAGTSGPNFKPTRETLADAYAKTGASIIVNSSGWDDATGEIKGAQIKGGVVYHQFVAPTGGATQGEYALGFRADGTVRVYSSNYGDSAASMVADGVVDSFGFGPALVRNGTKEPITGSAISARQSIGVDARGNVLIASVWGVTGSAGATYPQLADLAFSLGMVNAVALDGGGSVQALVNGGWSTPSSDPAPRPVVDTIVVNARVAAPTETPWVPLTLLNGFTAGVVQPAVKLLNGVVWFRGAPVNGAVVDATKVADLPWWAKPGAYKRYPYTTSNTVGVYFDVDTTGALLTASSSTVAGPRYLDVIRYPVGG